MESNALYVTHRKSPCVLRSSIIRRCAVFPLPHGAKTMLVFGKRGVPDDSGEVGRRDEVVTQPWLLFGVGGFERVLREPARRQEVVHFGVHPPGSAVASTFVVLPGRRAAVGVTRRPAGARKPRIARANCPSLRSDPWPGGRRLRSPRQAGRSRRSPRQVARRAARPSAAPPAMIHAELSRVRHTSRPATAASATANGAARGSRPSCRLTPAISASAAALTPSSSAPAAGEDRTRS